MSDRRPIGPFIDGRLPPTAPAEATGWAAVPAFPHLTFRDPTFLTFEPGTNRLYVGTLRGVIYRFVNDPETRTATVFLDVSNRTQISDSSGLLGMAFHPEFGQAGSPNRGYVYIYYQYWPTARLSYEPSYNRLSRFTVPDGGSAVDPNSELVLIQQYDPDVWHNGGGMFFAEDGFLYLSMGDAGGAHDSFNTAQLLDAGLFSGVLRIDVDMDPARSHPIRRQPISQNPAMPSFTGNYYIPNDNPFLDPNGSILEEFWAIGLRSPHRMTYDYITRRIWSGDVGQSGMEEINIIVKGGNYQWPYREGTLLGIKPKPDPLIGFDQPPVYAYPDADGNNSAIGGYVYRGTEHAAFLDGMYIFGDNGSGRIWALRYDGGSVPTATFLCNLPPGSGLFGLSSFGEDQNGEIYMCKLGNPGGIYKLSRSQTIDPEPPALLSQTGVFSDLAALTPVPAFIPYNVNSELWSDNARKRRWIAVPNDGAPYGAGEVVAFSPQGAWSFPAGTVFVKHFELPIDETNPSVVKRLETRLLVRDTAGSVYGVTYKWRDDGSDADLLSGSLNEDIIIRTASGTRAQTWYYPSRQACFSCHTSDANYVLGVNTRQLNGSLTYPGTGVTDNQLRTWNHIGMFASPISESAIPGYDKLVAVTDTSALLEHRVRSYIDANCAHCHFPGGARAFFDARFDTPLAEQRIIEGAVANSLGLPDAHVIAPGSVERSVMHRRLNTNDGLRMPPLARNVIDVSAVSTLAQWVESLTGGGGTVPSPWRNGDIGWVIYDGSASYAGGTYTVNGAGHDIWSTADAFHFVYQPWSGDGEIVARVTGLQNTHPWAKAGVMFRETLAAGSRNAFMVLTPGNGAVFQRRDTTDGITGLTAGSYMTAPAWVKLVRSGGTFSGYQSLDGSTWTLVGTASISMAQTIYVGIALTSHEPEVLCRATFDSVSVAAGGASPTIPAAPSNLTATAVSASRIDLAWTDNSGNEESFRIERSTSGGSFMEIATVGPNVTAYSNSGLSASTTYTYRVRAANAAGNSAYSNTATATTPSASPPSTSDWLEADIGTVGIAGSYTMSGGTIAVRGSGHDIWDTVDGFHFLYRTLTGDCEIVARVASITDTHSWAKAGVMIRESLAANARNTFALITPSSGLAAQNRATTGGTTSLTHGPWGLAAPYWVRLVRTGTTIVASASPDGANWTTVATYTVSMGSTVHVGLAVTSHNNGALCTGTFSNVSVTGGTGGSPTIPAAPSNLTATAVSASRIDLAWTDNSGNEESFKVERSSGGAAFTQIATVAANATSYSDTGVAASTTYSYRVRAANSAGDSAYSNTGTATTPSAPPPSTSDWLEADIGAVGIAGSHTVSGGTIAVRGSGHDIWDTADGFHFLYRTLTGDCTIVARVVSLTNTHSWAKAGVMIRDSLAANARNTFALVTPSSGLAAQNRATTGGTTSLTSGPWGLAAPYWVRLVRTGSTIVASASPDGANWTTVATYTVSIGSTVHVGLAVTSHDNSVLATGAFDNVTVSGGSSEPPPATTVNAPSGLTAIAVSASQINLGWTDNSTNETGFEVERAAGGASFTRVASVGANATAYSDTAVTAGTTYSYRVRAVASGSMSAYSNTASATPSSSTWGFGDIGAVSIAGANTSSGNTITISGSGSDIGGTADAFRFVYRPVTGDGVVETQVTSMENTHNWAKAGVMVRESLVANARNAFAFVTPAQHGVGAQARAVTGGDTTSLRGPRRNAPYWVRLTRTGNSFTAASSPDGVTWATYATFTIDMGATVYFGFAVTSRDDKKLNTAVFTDPFVR